MCLDVQRGSRCPGAQNLLFLSPWLPQVRRLRHIPCRARAAAFPHRRSALNGLLQIDRTFSLPALSCGSPADVAFVHYNPEDNTLWLVKDDASGWWGPGTPGSAIVLSNGEATLYCAQTTASRSGTTVEVTWNVSFKTAYKGTKNLYLYVKDQAGLTEGNVNKGTWTIY